MGLVEQGARPSGRLGKFLGRLMNQVHIRLYISYFTRHFPEKCDHILDIGCGGGRFVIINPYPAENTKWWRNAVIKNDAA